MHTSEAWTLLAVLGAILAGGLVGRMWRPVRKFVVAVDVLTGRPARYEGDPEERPGLAERLDRIDGSIAHLKEELSQVRQEVGVSDG